MQTSSDPRVIVTPNGSFRVFDDAGRLIGTVRQPVGPDPFGPGREKVYLERSGSLARSTAA